MSVYYSSRYRRRPSLCVLNALFLKEWELKAADQLHKTGLLKIINYIKIVCKIKLDIRTNKSNLCIRFYIKSMNYFTVFHWSIFISVVYLAGTFDCFETCFLLLLSYCHFNFINILSIVISFGSFIFFFTYLLLLFDPFCFLVKLRASEAHARLYNMSYTFYCIFETFQRNVLMIRSNGMLFIYHFSIKVTMLPSVNSCSTSKNHI